MTMPERLVLLACGHRVLASATAIVVRCAACNRLVRVDQERGGK